MRNSKLVGNERDYFPFPSHTPNTAILALPRLQHVQTQVLLCLSIAEHIAHIPLIPCFADLLGIIVQAQRSSDPSLLTEGTFHKKV